MHLHFENPFSKSIGGFIVFAVRTNINLNLHIFHANKVTFNTLLEFVFTSNSESRQNFMIETSSKCLFT